MALQKQPVAINFAKGLDTKTDPYQIQVGSFLTLVNSVFTSAGRLTKRFGNTNITNLPNALQTTLTTFNDNLIATGSNLYAYNKDNNVWINEGIVQPITMSTISMIRANTGQINQDSAVAPNGLACLVYNDTGSYYYQILDSSTGQHITNRIALPATSDHARVFVLGVYFIVMYTTTAPTLSYIAIPINNPNAPRPAAIISSTLSSSTDGWDGYVINNALYLSWSASGASIDICYLDQFLVRSAVVSSATASSQQLMSVTADSTRVYVSYWSSSSNNGFSKSFDYALNPIMTSTPTVVSTLIAELTSIVANNTLIVLVEVVNGYIQLSPPANRTDFINKYVITPPVATGAGTTVGPTLVRRSLGLASKPILDNGTVYFMTTYGDTATYMGANASNQPTYFLLDSNGQIYMKLAYSVGGGYTSTQVLPSISKLNDQYYVSYLIVDQLTSTNKTTNPPTDTPVNQITTLTGINMAVFAINTTQYSSEIAGSLHLTGGQEWQYDGVTPVEFGFHVWPENITSTESGSGNMAAGTYFVVFTYEWTDNSGKIHRSAPSIPVEVIVSINNASIVSEVPTLRLTEKLAPNPVRIVGYRYSLAQPIYYQFTSITNPVVNDTTIDTVTVVDTLSDAQILGNPILYTTGGVVENIAPPASIASALFKNRLWLVDAEDQNLLWYSKTVIENVPVEMSDLFTLYVAPTSGAQGSTGSITALSAMDDKLIIFKKDAIYYLTGTGPDNTGANNDFTDPVFITASVGCAIPNSITLMPNGIMFQSDKGIWLLGRDLNTTYIGAPVEAFNSNVILSAQAIPGTNQVRFLSTNQTLMYDYFFSQWGTFTNIEAISATLYQGKHTYLNSVGQVFQENTNSYFDGSEPVLMSFITSWINVAGLQGFERFYFLYLLGTYYSAFRLQVGVAYNYNSSLSQSTIVTQDNYVPAYGEEALWGSGGPWGGTGAPFQARVFPMVQKCESFQLTFNEIFDPTLMPNNGQGLTLSGLNMVIGVKRGYRTQKAARSFG